MPLMYYLYTTGHFLFPVNPTDENYTSPPSFKVCLVNKYGKSKMVSITLLIAAISYRKITGHWPTVAAMKSLAKEAQKQIYEKIQQAQQKTR